MAYSTLAPLTRIANMGSCGDATSRADSVKWKWGHATVDTAATVETANYYPGTTQAGYAGWNIGDVVEAIMNAATGQTPVVKTYVITTLTGTTSGLTLQTVTAG